MTDKDKLNELYIRRNLARYCIRLVSEVDKSDPRRADALAEYNRQLLAIDEKIAAITGEIPPVSVGLETAKLTPRSNLGV